MPNSKLFKGDFSKGLVEELKQQKYDAIIATYSLHNFRVIPQLCWGHRKTYSFAQSNKKTTQT